MNIASNRVVFDFFVLRIRKYNPNDAVLVCGHIDDVVPDRPRIICEPLHR